MLGSNARKSRSGDETHLAYNKTGAKANKERTNARRRARYAEDPAKILTRNKRQKLKDRYGMTPEQQADLFAQQGCVCAICRADRPSSRTGWHTDHDHETGQVRGVLCHHCNIMLGMSKDNSDTLRAAVEYLETHTWKTAH